MNRESELVARIRERLNSGAIPVRAPARTWGGKATGQTCAVCDDTIIGNGEIETDGADARTRYYHPRCFTLLIRERAERRP